LDRHDLSTTSTTSQAQVTEQGVRRHPIDRVQHAVRMERPWCVGAPYHVSRDQVCVDQRHQSVVGGGFQTRHAQACHSPVWSR
ncbi:fbox protein, partial [Nannochloropsis gaditana CCMP526]|uniref:fbox protein n=1 Tax=Nannochloropsis gaditana (strain CCMP526) TaxID=1093141 RepID=UPI00029F5A2C